MPIRKKIGSEEKSAIFDSLWEFGITGFAIVDENDYFSYANDSYCKLLEYTQAELQERTWKQVTHPEDLKADNVQTRQVQIGDRKTHDMRKRYITKTGRVVWVVMRVLPIKKDNGEFAYFLAQVSPILQISPPAQPADYKAEKMPSIFEIVGQGIKSNWKEMLIVLGSLAYLIAEAVKYYKK